MPCLFPAFVSPDHPMLTAHKHSTCVYFMLLQYIPVSFYLSLPLFLGYHSVTDAVSEMKGKKPARVLSNSHCWIFP